jgi:hypothetical protein
MCARPPGGWWNKCRRRSRPQQVGRRLHGNRSNKHRHRLQAQVVHTAAILSRRSTPTFGSAGYVVQRGRTEFRLWVRSPRDLGEFRSAGRNLRRRPARKRWHAMAREKGGGRKKRATCAMCAMLSNVSENKQARGLAFAARGRRRPCARAERASGSAHARSGRNSLAQSQALRSKRQDVDAAFSHLVAVMGEPYPRGPDYLGRLIEARDRAQAAMIARWTP